MFDLYLHYLLTSSISAIHEIEKKYISINRRVHRGASIKHELMCVLI
jgi:hypothetical protein